jgi:hypothetical protein
MHLGRCLAGFADSFQRGHDIEFTQIPLGDDIAEGNYAHNLVLHVHDRQAPDVVLSHEFKGLADIAFGGTKNRIVGGGSR